MRQVGRLLLLFKMRQSEKLHRKKYFIFNQKFSKEEYVSKVAVLRQKPPVENLKEMEKVRVAEPHLYSRQHRSERVLGDFANNSKNCFMCFDCEGCQDCGYLFKMYNVYGERSYDTYDVDFAVALRKCYEMIQGGDAENCNFFYFSEDIYDSEFAYTCFNSNHLFGCINLNHGEYALLNRKMDKEQWHMLMLHPRASPRSSFPPWFCVLLQSADRSRRSNSRYSLCRNRRLCRKSGPRP